MIDARMIDARPIDARTIDTPPPPQGPTFVQGGSVQSFGNGVQYQFAAALQAGDLVVFGVSFGSTNTQISSVSDSDGNTYHPIGSPIVVNNVGTLAMYYAEGVKAGSTRDTITVQLNQGFITTIIAAASYRGIATSNALDANASANGNGTSVSSGGVMTNHAHDLVIGIGAAQSNLSAGSGQMLRVGPGLDIIEDREVMTTGNYSATATQQMNFAWLMGVAAFEAAN